MAACLLCLAGHSLALQPDKRFSDYVGDTWGIEHGLPQVSVLSITQDRDGYLWLGSQGGLARYDGSRFTGFDQRDAPELGSHALALQGDRARAAIESQVAVPLRMPLLEAAHGVYVLAATTMTPRNPASSDAKLR